MNYIVTTNTDRRRLWQQLFNTDRLPVKTARPRLMCLPHLGEVLAYDLDSRFLHNFALIRFADHVANVQGVSVDDVNVDGWPILADNCKPARDVKPPVGFSFG